MEKNIYFLTLPNLLTLFRIILVPIVIFLVLLKSAMYDFIAAVLFGIAAITDFFDGYLARKRKQESVYGEIMDPLADKILVMSSLTMLQWQDSLHPIPIIIFNGRDLLITSLRAVCSAQGVMLKTSLIAKWKTALQLIGIPFVMSQIKHPYFPLYYIGHVLLWMALIVSVYSCVDYLSQFRQLIVKKQQTPS